MSVGVSESPLYIEGPDGPMFGIETVGPDPQRRIVFCTGGWHGGSINGNRMIVHLARRLAEAGCAVLRFDWFGAGESPGSLDYFRIDRPAVDQTEAAVRSMEAATFGPLSLVGICLGSRSALAAAPLLANLESLILVSFPFPTASTKQKRAERISAKDAVRQGLRPSVLRGWLEPATRRVYIKFLKLRWQAVRRRFAGDVADVEAIERRQMKDQQDRSALVAQVSQLAEAGVDVTFLYGTGDAGLGHFEAARQGELDRLLADPASPVRLRMIDGDLSGYSSLDAQKALIDAVAGWFEHPDRA